MHVVRRDERGGENGEDGGTAHPRNAYGFDLHAAARVSAPDPAHIDVIEAITRATGPP